MKTFDLATFLTMHEGTLFLYTWRYTENTSLETQIAVKGKTFKDGSGFEYRLLKFGLERDEETRLWNLPTEQVPAELVPFRDCTSSERITGVGQRGLQPTYTVIDPDDHLLLSELLDNAYHIYQRTSKHHWKIAKDKRKGNVHVDDFTNQSPYFFDFEDSQIDGLKYLHFKIMYFRFPASFIAAYRKILGNAFPLFLDYEGKTWKVTGASRLGDLHLSKNLKAEEGAGYDRREVLNLELMTGFRRQAVPDTAADFYGTMPTAPYRTTEPEPEEEVNPLSTAQQAVQEYLDQLAINHPDLPWWETLDIERAEQLYLEHLDRAAMWFVQDLGGALGRERTTDGEVFYLAFNKRNRPHADRLAYFLGEHLESTADYGDGNLMQFKVLQVPTPGRDNNIEGYIDFRFRQAPAQD